MTLTPGTPLGPYEIVAPLGAGGMGEVYRARDSRLGRDVAIKALPAEFAGDAERLARFQREARTLAALNHTNIAAIYGLEESGGLPYLVLELVDGETLATRLVRGAMPPREALALGVQVAAAVEAAHERGIVHRDLKPGNVMITPGGAAKVLDFGLARLDAASAPTSDLDLSATPTRTVNLGDTVAGAIVGTAAYMSPEQARGRPVDRRSDVWSFGCVLFECLAGRPAFAGDTVSDLIARILEREPEWSALPAGVPPRAREILRRCLRKEADARPRDIRDVRLELSELLSGPAAGESAIEHSIAVLPFENMSGADDAYFADGITDEILNALAQLDGLRVAARSSCFAFKGRREDPRRVGEALDVAAVLEGTVRRAGSRLRITAQLVNAADGYQLWSERYDREMTDVFEVQDEIAGAIASRLKLSFHGGSDAAGKPRHGTSSLEAYELFLKGRVLQLQRGASVFDAIRCFEQAIALDPDYIEALAWLADSYRLLGTYGVRPSHEVMPRARDVARRALGLDPTQEEARCTLADILGQYDHDYAGAAALWEEVLAANPRNVRARCERSLWLVGSGSADPEWGVAETLRASQDEPLNAWVHGMRSYLLGYAGRHAEAIEAAARAVEVDPESFFARFVLAQSYAWSGDDTRALELMPPVLLRSGRHVWALGTLGWLHGRAGRHEPARAIYDELDGRSRHEFVSPAWLAIAAAAAGLEALAMHHVREALNQRDPFLVVAPRLPQWQLVRRHAWFPELVLMSGVRL